MRTLSVCDLGFSNPGSKFQTLVVKLKTMLVQNPGSSCFWRKNPGSNYQGCKGTLVVNHTLVSMRDFIRRVRERRFIT